VRVRVPAAEGGGLARRFSAVTPGKARRRSRLKVSGSAADNEDVALRRVYLVYSSDRTDDTKVESSHAFGSASSSTPTGVTSGWKALIAASVQAASTGSPAGAALSVT
jgi:hypothetical protein